MLITNTPICPRCHETIMSRYFTGFDWFGMILLAVLLFPLAIWIYLNPRYLFCRSCGAKLGQFPMRS
jgi:hypothetical protein